MRFGLPHAVGLGVVAGALALAAAAAAKTPPMRNPVLLNIGFVCRWESRCVERQQRAMKRALAYVRSARPPAWKVQLCNRNASRSRGRGRVDWIGFNNCIRNPKLTRPAAGRRRG
jgi:hypothetical protein